MNCEGGIPGILHALFVNIHQSWLYLALFLRLKKKTKSGNVLLFSRAREQLGGEREIRELAHAIVEVKSEICRAV